MEKGKIYLVSTPIGNLEDITFRAINTLNSVDYIAAEDTRTSQKLLNHYDIKKPIFSYHMHNENEKSDYIIKLINSGKNIAVISDAGTPGISDPGEILVKKAIKENIQVIPIPGASACLSGLICSGFDTNHFTFYGFLDIKQSKLISQLEKIKLSETTTILYEAPHRLLKTLSYIKDVFGNIDITICKELTKIHENFYRDKILELLNSLPNPKGEYVIILPPIKKENNLNNLSLDEHFSHYISLGYDKKQAIKQIASDRNVHKNEIYQYFTK